MVKGKIIICWVFCFIATSFGFGQTVNVDAGCVPLEVDFTSPDGTDYFWTFGDNASSELQNPTHAYTSPGEYVAELFDGENGSKIGEVEITVYEDPIIIISANSTVGCSPFNGTFSAEIIINPEITITSYLWTFGDGSSSTDETPSYTYTNAGTYDVSLSVTTNLTECNTTVINQQFIMVTGVEGSFQVTNLNPCEVPATFQVNNQSENSNENQYIWDFGNGEEFIGYSPPSINYTESGSYEITLTIINEAGCESIITRNVSIGLIPLDITVEDSVCLSQSVPIFNTDTSSMYTWSFGDGSSTPSSNEPEPIHSYSTVGNKTITLEVIDENGCETDTSFIVNVSDVSAAFSYTPDPLPCTQPLTMTFTADDPSFESYEWSFTDETGPVINHDWSWPIRDSLHLHWEDSLNITLIVMNSIGCTDIVTQQIRQRKPDAYFTVDKSKGCFPLTINFTDDTRSKEEVLSWRYIYGNGDEATFSNDDDHSFTYEEPGEYYVRLIIENIAGCIDTSAGIWIQVGEPIPSTYEIDKTEICLGDTINLEMFNLDERIDAWHFTSDENRLNHCWTSPVASHVFVHEPGSFPLTVTTEYNGCYWSETTNDAIQVNGAKANVGYMTNCETPFDVMFMSKSKNASQLSWDIETPDQYAVENFTHSFSNKGVYEIFLTADDGSGCPISVDSATIHIVQPEAHFELDEFVCDNKEYELNASASVDVNNTCHKGYLWYLPNNRPRELGDSEVDAFFIDPGDQEVTLIVEDINGCTDTLTKQTRSFSMVPNFEFDKDRICLPSTVNFTDISMSDTTIVEWDWSFGGTDSLETFTFNEGTPVPLGIFLTVKDAVGCTDVQSRFIQVYEPTSDINIDNGPGICVGEEITFNATDFIEEGSFLNFIWDFGQFGSGTNQSETVVFDDNGQFEINLSFIEDSTGCQGETTIDIEVIDVPTANFSTPVDEEIEICHPAIIAFTNQSMWEGPVFHRWSFGNGNVSNQINTAEAFSKGTYDVNLIVQSIYGCSDTIVKTYNLVGPEGDLVLDKDVVCPGETITIEMINPIDVNSFTWVLGDGTIVEDVNPLEHMYDFYPENGQTKIDLILKSAENGCEFIITEPITIVELQADFEFSDSSHCEGLAYFENTSAGSYDEIIWDFGNGETSNEENPQVIYEELGNYTVSLEVVSDGGTCRTSISKEINLEDVEEFIFFPNVFTPNNDGQNDFFNVVVKPGFEDVVSINTFQVYNRWGNLVYDNETPDFGWNGENNTTPSPAEVYAYYINVEITDCTNKAKKGNVTIVR